MIIKKLQDVPFTSVPGHDQVKKQIVLGPDDGSKEIVMRYFSVDPGGASPHHSHDFPHLVKIEAGEGVAIDTNGNEHQVKEGDYIYITDNETHQLRNTGSKPFAFVCIVPRRGEG